MKASTGGLLDSSTMTVKVCEALRLGTPSSVTVTVTGFVLGPWASVGTHVMTPFVGLMIMPAGAFVPRLYVNIVASTSLTDVNTTSKLPSITIWLAMGASTGASFTGFRVMLTVAVP